MRLARRRVGLSQRGLADALGWSRAKVGRWESGTLPQGFDEVVSLLRVLGFETALRDPTAAQWAECDEPAEHVLDRGDRRFPAHLELCAEDTSQTYNWTRHRGEPSPNAAQTSFRCRTQVKALADERESREWARGERESSAESGTIPPPVPDAS
jgi:HTH-type transcriptional regulator/antitoxin HipB